MKSKGRPVTKPIQLMDGFYIEVRNRGSNERGVKIRSESRESMDINIMQYTRSNKEVFVLGEYKNFEWLSEKKNNSAKKKVKETAKQD